MALLVKGLMFAFFAYQFVQNYPASWIINRIFIISGDTSGYYVPIEDFVNGLGYTSFCRMPGLLPIYAPLYWLFGEIWGRTCVIVLQFLTSSLSVYILGRIAFLMFNNLKVFYLTFFLYAFSSFVSIWDHYGYSDSFSVSFLIFSIYLLFRYLKEGRTSLIFFSGLFIAWSLFFRPTQGIMLPVMLLILWANKKYRLKTVFLPGLIFCVPTLLGLAAWGGYNKVKHEKIVFLQGPASECFGSLTDYHLAIRGLVISWGGDFQEWSKGSRSEWFFSADTSVWKTNPFTPDNFAGATTLDSMIALREDNFQLSTNKKLTEQEKRAITARILTKTKKYENAYVLEHPFRYYFLNRLIILRKFVFPKRLDNLPFPKLSEMKWYQVLIKGGYLILLLLVNLFGLAGILVTIRQKRLFALIPLANILLIGLWFGFVEQRYLAPSYPFFCIYACYFLYDLLNRWRNRQAGRRTSAINMP